MDKKYKNIKNINEWKVDKEYDEFFNIINDEDDDISEEEIIKYENTKRLSQHEQIKSLTTRKTPMLSMEQYRNRIMKHKENGDLTKTYDEINISHNKLYGCDFEPKI